MRPKKDLTEIHIIIHECSVKKQAVIVRKIAHIMNLSRRQSYELYSRAAKTAQNINPNT